MAGAAASDDPTYADSMFASLTAGAEDRPESRLLDRLVGSWRTRTEWEPIVGHGVRVIEGRVDTEWAFAGRLLRSTMSNADGTPTGELILAFDGLVGDYIGFAFTALSTFYAVERGGYDPTADRWELDAFEPRRDGGPPVRFRRSIQMLGPDAYESSISYPDVPVGTYGPMAIAHERIS